MFMAAFLSLDARQRSHFRRRQYAKQGQAGPANKAYLLPCFHRYARRNALGPDWPIAKPAVLRMSKSIPLQVSIVRVADCLNRQATELGCLVSTEYSMTLTHQVT
jgi:hypothetical protein